MVKKPASRTVLKFKTFTFINIYCVFKIQNYLVWLTPFWLYGPSTFPLRSFNPLPVVIRFFRQRYDVL